MPPQFVVVVNKTSLRGRPHQPADCIARWRAATLIGSGFLLLVPAIIGTFWAAPLLTREFEAGTFQLAWTQSVTRTRWLAAKLGVGVLAAMATACLSACC